MTIVKEKSIESENCVYRRDTKGTLSGNDLIAILDKMVYDGFDMARPVIIDGCDCSGDANGVTVELDGTIRILRD